MGQEQKMLRTINIPKPFAHMQFKRNQVRCTRMPPYIEWTGPANASLETRPSPSSTRACSVSYNYAWEYFFGGRRPGTFYHIIEGRYIHKRGQKNKKKGKVRKILIKNRFIEFDPQQVEGQLVPRLLRMLHDVLTTLLL